MPWVAGVRSLLHMGQVGYISTTHWFLLHSTLNTTVHFNGSDGTAYTRLSPSGTGTSYHGNTYNYCGSSWLIFPPNIWWGPCHSLYFSESKVKCRLHIMLSTESPVVHYELFLSLVYNFPWQKHYAPYFIKVLLFFKILYKVTYPVYVVILLKSTKFLSIHGMLLNWSTKKIG